MKKSIFSFLTALFFLIFIPVSTVSSAPLSCSQFSVHVDAGQPNGNEGPIKQVILKFSGITASVNGKGYGLSVSGPPTVRTYYFSNGRARGIYNKGRSLTFSYFTSGKLSSIAYRGRLIRFYYYTNGRIRGIEYSGYHLRFRYYSNGKLRGVFGHIPCITYTFYN
ncbi:hypothetical protein [Hippea maritima]|uniref:MORN repeat-containing protein n=1 Tax=Hippea maritima (strain ATCC 700847 / DSM 10411 / MH2) TaxID=760142 RepID=F2LY47_HIPMA|nr:hypothetical protein [Hippea maritima]AEA34370.1 hypothetical protein Hipma_1414 [Hippea maritima DSM 10411]